VRPGHDPVAFEGRAVYAAAEAMVSRIARALSVSLAAGALVFTVAGCKSCGNAAPEGKPRVAVSIYPVYDLVRKVAGPDADVSLLLQPGKNEHSFDPTPRDVEEVSKARIGVMVGLGLDPWMEKLMKDAAPSAKVLKVGDRVPTRPIEAEAIGEEEAHAAHGGKDDDDHDHEKGAIDPHVWLDPQNARLIVRAFAEEISKIDAAHATDYRKRADALDKDLDALDKELEKRAAALPKKGFVTFHGSFGYFAKRYGLSILAVIEPFPGSQPSGAYVQKVLGVIREKKVPALYSEPQLDPRPAKVLSDEAKIPLGVLDPVGGGPETDDYAKMLRFDMTELEKYQK
jgi:zinc transport system substrate-binding protein